MRTHRRVLQFNNDGTTTTRGGHSSRNNISRTNSTLDATGLRIPRNRLSWLYHRDHNGGNVTVCNRKDLSSVLF